MNHLSSVDAVWIAFAMLFPIVLYLFFSAYQARQRASTYKAVMDRISSGEDFAAFLQSTAGQKFITDLSGSESPVRAVIGAIQKGMILVSLGGGVWWTGAKLESNAEVAGIGVLLLCVGAGILISAGISYRLSKSWGLIDEHDREDREK
jgi:hypothetical protein